MGVVEEDCRRLDLKNGETDGMPCFVSRPSPDLQSSPRAGTPRYQLGRPEGYANCFGYQPRSRVPPGRVTPAQSPTRISKTFISHNRGLSGMTA
jgi:hypothetical protein